MGGKKMEGNEDQKRQAARDAREEGKRPSEMGATTGASQQHTDAKPGMSHQERMDLKREGKEDIGNGPEPEARPRSRENGPDHQEKYPRH